MGRSVNQAAPALGAASLFGSEQVVDLADEEDGKVYVQRDAAGQIVSLSRLASKYQPEQCLAESPDVIAFLQKLSPRNAALQESDLSLIRALEDLIDVLIRKEVLRLTDLPDSVQTKLLSRRRLRGSVRSLSLLGDDASDL